MSSRRNPLFLANVDGLLEDGVSQGWVNGVAHDQIDPGNAKQVLQPVLKSEEVKQSYRPVELDQEVHIACPTSLMSRIASERSAEISENPEALETGIPLCRSVKSDFFA